MYIGSVGTYGTDDISFQELLRTDATSAGMTIAELYSWNTNSGKDGTQALYYITLVDTSGEGGFYRAYKLGGYAADTTGASIVNETANDDIHLHVSNNYYAGIRIWKFLI